MDEKDFAAHRARMRRAARKVMREMGIAPKLVSEPRPTKRRGRAETEADEEAIM